MADIQAFRQIQTGGGERDLGWEKWRVRVDTIYNLDRDLASTQAQLQFSEDLYSASLKTITNSATSLQREGPLSWVSLDIRDVFWLLFGDLMLHTHTHSPLPSAGFRTISCRALC